MDSHNEIAKKVWEDCKEDNIRWCTSGYHGIAPADESGSKISAESFVEEAFSDIDIGDPRELDIDIAGKSWGNFLSDQYFLAEYCKVKFEALKQYNCFDFEEPENEEAWFQFVGKYL